LLIGYIYIEQLELREVDVGRVNSYYKCFPHFEWMLGIQAPARVLWQRRILVFLLACRWLVLSFRGAFDGTLRQWLEYERLR
jgi:hypothetical protein